MSTEANTFFRAEEHRGCNIQVASYEVRPQTWIPEACVLLETEQGSRKLWVRSFAHCFASDNVTFDNKIEADHWAFFAARAIIDKALPEFNAASLPNVAPGAKRLARVLRIARLPVRALDRFRYLIHRR